MENGGNDKDIPNALYLAENEYLFIFYSCIYRFGGQNHLSLFGLQGEQGLRGQPGTLGQRGQRGAQGDQGRRGEPGLKGQPVCVNSEAIKH